MDKAFEGLSLNDIPQSVGRYPYEQLDAGKSEFRLFLLHPRTSSRVEDLRITIFKDVLNGTGGKTLVQNFQALSYVWGDASDTRDIMVILHTQGIEVICKLKITSSLAETLIHYPFRDKHVVLWADGICIDQDNFEERAQQVGLMQRIYSEADVVTAWLGSEANNSNLALNLLTRIGESIHVDLITSQVRVNPVSPWLNRSEMERGYTMLLLNKDFDIPWDGPEAKAIEALFHRPWFERLWIRQEVLLGDTRTVLLCGRSSITWPNFRKAVFMLSRKRVADAHPRKLDWIKRTYLISRIWTHANSPLRMLMRDLRDTACSNPRDRVYGMLGIMPIASVNLAQRILPDYNKSPAAVYGDLVKADLSVNHRADLLTECYTSDSSWKPSWVPNWAGKPEIPIDILENCADGQSAATGTIPSDGKTLTLKGKFVATVSKTWKPLKSPSSVGESLDAARLSTVAAIKELAQRLDLDGKYPTGENNLAALAISLSRGRDTEHLTWGLRTEHHQSIAQYKALIKLALEHADDHAAIRHSSCKQNGGYNGAIGHATAFARNSMIMTTEGYFGSCPITALPGDRVCVFLGCMAPIVLRPSKENEGFFTVVGPCTVHGLNWGEALLGAFPEDIGFIWNLSGPHGGAGPAFLDRKMGEETLVDPRIEWESLRVNRREDAFVFRQMLDGSGTDFFRRPDAEYFKVKGVGLEDVRLI